MIAFLTAVLVAGGPLPQEETGIPISPFSGLEGGAIFARFPRDWGLVDEGRTGWYGSVILGGVTCGDEVEFMARFTWRQWDDLEFFEANGEILPEPIESRFRSAVIDFSADAGLGPLRVGMTLGGGLMLLKHALEREIAPLAEGGLYLRFKPLGWIYLEGGGLAAATRDDFNRDSTRTDVMWTVHGAAGIELRF